MLTKLYLITKRSREDKKCKFNNLMHLINVESLKECYHSLKKNKALGVDKVSVEEYGKNLDSNLEDLIERMKKMAYRPQKIKRVYIPKSNGKKRPLGIPSTEDKLVQLAFTRILEAIYEPDFYNFSFGFRKGRSCHQAIKYLDHNIMSNQVNFVLDADICGFFDNINHKWMIRCLEERITDKKFLRYITRFLKSGFIHEGKEYKTTQGSPQGGIISPILANIYLHYILDLWFEKKMKRSLKGFSFMVRYCDDFVICFQYEDDIKIFLEELKSRFKKFDLFLSEEKTHILKFSRYGDNGKPPSDNRTFCFLGLRHYIGKSRKGKPIVKHQTDGKRINRALHSISNWLRSCVHKLKLPDIWSILSSKLIGHYRYYGISGNIRSLKAFRNKTLHLLHKHLSRRSQRSRITFERFYKMLEKYPLPYPKIYFNLYSL